MPKQNVPPIQIVFEMTCPEEDERAVIDLFAEFGIPVDALVHLRESELPQTAWDTWQILMSTPITTFFSVYCVAIAVRLGGETVDAAKHLVSHLWQTRLALSGPKGDVVVRDEGSAIVDVQLDEDLPREAFEALEHVRPATFSRSVRLRYDRGTGEWRPVSDEP